MYKLHVQSYQQHKILSSHADIKKCINVNLFISVNETV